MKGRVREREMGDRKERYHSTALPLMKLPLCMVLPCGGYMLKPRSLSITSVLYQVSCLWASLGHFLKQFSVVFHKVSKKQEWWHCCPLISPALLKKLFSPGREIESRDEKLRRDKVAYLDNISALLCL